MSQRCCANRLEAELPRSAHVAAVSVAQKHRSRLLSSVGASLVAQKLGSRVWSTAGASASTSSTEEEFVRVWSSAGAELVAHKHSYRVWFRAGAMLLVRNQAFAGCAGRPEAELTH